MDFMPWRDQVRIAWRAVLWVIWNPDLRAWSNAAGLLAAITMGIAIAAQLWPVLLAGFFLWCASGYYGRRAG